MLAGEHEQFFVVRIAGSYLSSSDPTLHLGLEPGIDSVSVEVTWPSGLRSTQRVAAGSLVLITEPAVAKTGLHQHP